MLLVGILFAACDEDYSDWSEPQGYPQEEPVNLTFSVNNNGVDDINLGTVSTDSVVVANISEITTLEGGSVKYEVTLTDDDEKSVAMAYGVVGSEIKVNTKELRNAIWSMFGKAHQTVEASLKIVAIITSAEGQAIRVEASGLSVSVETEQLPIAADYYLIGDPNEWKTDALIKFTSVGDSIFELQLETTAENQNIKIVPSTAVGSDSFWQLLLGAEAGHGTDVTGTLKISEAGNEADAIIIATTGKKKITLDMKAYTYTISDVVETMFIIGSPWGWDWNSVGASMTIVNGEKRFWSINYFAANAEIKFSPEKAWSGKDFGFSAVTDEAKAKANLTENEGNIKVGKAGWYIVVVNTDGGNTVDFYDPEVWLVGAAATGEWDNIAGNSLNLFTVPATANGEFESPAFIKDGELRMCVKLPNADWWKTEFMILDGKIAYRGNGGDQERVNITAGKKAYLKFSDGTGRIQ